MTVYKNKANTIINKCKMSWRDEMVQAFYYLALLETLQIRKMPSWLLLTYPQCISYQDSMKFSKGVIPAHKLWIEQWERGVKNNFKHIHFLLPNLLPQNVLAADHSPALEPYILEIQPFTRQRLALEFTFTSSHYNLIWLLFPPSLLCFIV